MAPCSEIDTGSLAFCRWQPDNVPHKLAAKEGEEEKDVFGDSFEEDEPLPVRKNVLEATKSSASPILSEPQLIGAPLGGLFSDSLDFRGSVRPKKVRVSLESCMYILRLPGDVTGSARSTVGKCI